MDQSTMLNVVPAVAAMPDRLELKPERVQELARQLGWEESEGVPGLHRSRMFHSFIEAEAYAAFVFKMAGRRRQPVTVNVTGRQVSIALQGRTGRNKASGITNAVYTLACALG